ncbi:MAG: DNA-protecting protein DprA [Candidatus Riflebacteria bacterium]|nr:DNA-protecting protein DprA [Candidatus Riflebacteria bacterium]
MNSGKMCELISAVKLMRIPGVGAELFKKLVIVFDGPANALRAISKNPDIPAKISGRKINAGKNHDIKIIEKTLSYLKNLRQNESASYYGDSAYPVRLRTVKEPPPVIFFRGNPEILNNKNSIAIVGARKASAKGIQIAQEISRYFSENGWVIVSGGASGIDAAAHEQALEIKGHTVAVLGSGINIHYPKKNQKLLEEIEEKGVILTEFFPGTPPVASHFPTRNRIIAALSDIVVLVEGSENSGSIYTVKNSVKSGKKTFCLDCRELNQGAKTLITNKYPKVQLIKRWWEITSAVNNP